MEARFASDSPDHSPTEAIKLRQYLLYKAIAVPEFIIMIEMVSFLIRDANRHSVRFKNDGCSSVGMSTYISWRADTSLQASLK